MTLLYTDPLFLEHRTGAHPECPERLVQITRRLEESGLKDACNCPTWSAASIGRLELVHGREYVASVQSVSEQGGGQIEADTVCSRRSYDVARHAAGAVCDAVEQVVRGEDRRALCLVRPPGHHALANAAMGFCLFGN